MNETRWDSRRWGETCRHIQVCLMQGNRRRAVMALDAYIRREQVIQLKPENHVCELEAFGLDVVSLGLLEQAGYQTIGSVMEATDYRLQLIPSMGDTRIQQIRRAIQAAGVGS